MKVGPNQYKTIYCHSDGYLTYNGAMLLDYYNDREKVEKLLSLGNLSVLNEKVEPDPTRPHSFDYNQRQEDVCVAYGRDRGEEGQESKILSFEELTSEETWIEYVYIFDENGEWQYSNVPFDEFDSVKNGLQKEYQKMGLKKRPPNVYGFLNKEEIEKYKKIEQQQDSEGEM
jgi:hypothetical protein